MDDHDLGRRHDGQRSLATFHVVRQLALLHLHLFDRRCDRLGSLFEHLPFVEAADWTRTRTLTISFLLVGTLRLFRGQPALYTACSFLQIDTRCAWYRIGPLLKIAGRSTRRATGNQATLPQAIRTDGFCLRPQDHLEAYLSWSVKDTDWETKIEQTSAVEDNKRTIEFLRPTIDVVARLFPPVAREQTIVCPKDLHEEVAMVDEQGTITAPLDWESTAALPL